MFYDGNIHLHLTEFYTSDGAKNGENKVFITEHEQDIQEHVDNE